MLIRAVFRCRSLPLDSVISEKKKDFYSFIYYSTQNRKMKMNATTILDKMSAISEKRHLALKI